MVGWLSVGGSGGRVKCRWWRGFGGCLRVLGKIERLKIGGKSEEPRRESP